MPIDSLLITIIAFIFSFTSLALTGKSILKKEIKRELIEELKNAR